MINQETIHVSITNNFIPTWIEFNELINKNKEFKKALKVAVERDKRLENKEKQNSIKVRYAIAHCLRDMKKQKLKNELEIKNEETKDRNL